MKIIPNWALIAPYAAWMAVMSFAPRTALWYAIRGAITALILIAAWAQVRRQLRWPGLRAWVGGLAVGIVVFVVWILPVGLLKVEEASPFDPAVCGWVLTIAKLIASAFVISIAEELFFRRWLVDFAGFWWMVALFAVEHGRWDSGAFAGFAFVAEGAFAGIAYGLLSKKLGLASVVIAHATTNLVLGLWIFWRGLWQFW